MDSLLFAPMDIRRVRLMPHADQAEAIPQGGRAELEAIGREMLHNPHWPIDAAQELGVASGFDHVPSAYGYWLERRAQSRFPGRASTWQAGIDPAPHAR